MSFVVSENENFADNFLDNTQFSLALKENMCEREKSSNLKPIQNTSASNIVHNILNRQLYGRFTKHPKAKTEHIFNGIHLKCRFALNSLIKDPDTFNHIFMGFTMCGLYFVSYTEKIYEDLGPLNFNTCYEYELYLWRFVPGQKLKFFAKHKIFKHLKGPDVLDRIIFMQFPNDLHKLVCYGLVGTNPDLVYISLLTLPSPKHCKHCNKYFSVNNDDYNIPIEIPMFVQNLTEHHLDVVPEFKIVAEMQLTMTQKSFDCEQFVQRRAQKLCSESELEFLHCEDYDIKIIHICPINGYIVCQVKIKIGALKKMEPFGKPEVFTANFLFTWSIETDAFDIMEVVESKLLPSNELENTPTYEIPKSNLREVLIMDYYYATTKTVLRDYNNYYEVCLGSANVPVKSNICLTEEYSSDSD